MTAVTGAAIEAAGSGPAAPDPVVNADGDCFLTGKVVMTLTRK